jgi:hypothetical protein
MAAIVEETPVVVLKEVCDLICHEKYFIVNFIGRS